MMFAYIHSRQFLPQEHTCFFPFVRLVLALVGHTTSHRTAQHTTSKHTALFRTSGLINFRCCGRLMRIDCTHLLCFDAALGTRNAVWV